MNNNTSRIVTNALSALIAIAIAIFFWDRVKSPILFVVTLGILVAIHEWGHFIAAKAVGVRVYEFALGFGPKLVTYMQRNGTDYTIRAFPLGGFVNPKGMQPDDPITHDGINGRRPAERALVFLAGPLMNVIFAVFIFLFSGYFVGSPDETVVLVAQVERKSAAAQMEVIRKDGQPVSGFPPGIRAGDRILAVDGQTVPRRDAVTSMIHPKAGKEVVLTVRRGGSTLEMKGVPKEQTREVPAVVVTQVPAENPLGLKAGDQIDRINGEYPGSRTEEPQQAVQRILREQAGQPVTLSVWRDGKYPVELQGPAAPVEVALKEVPRTFGILGFGPVPGQGPRMSLGESMENGAYAFVNFFRGLAAMFSRPKELKENTGGVIAIGSLVGQVAQLPALYYMGFLGSLSLSLAVFNLLPIPNLDGGHMLLLTWEVLRRRRLEPDTQRTVAMVGLVIIGVLFILITWKDITRHIL